MKNNYSQWPYVEARRIINRLKHQNKTAVTAQTGYGPSGLPHIGTFGEVARTSFVLQALEILEPGIKRHLISFSDDMDGLREVPKNLPNHEMIAKHLGKPLTSIPDPFGEEESFAHYMNRKLQEFLDSFGFEYEFASSTEKYRSGLFNDGLKRILFKHEKITKLFTKTISKEKRATWSPFFPICENCGKIYSTTVTGYNLSCNTITYVCDSTVEGKYKACGHSGEVSVLDGKCKVGWKVDWALRWFALDIDYEMHGEDLVESGRLSSKIVKEIGGRPPELFKYELFLDETGKKISKKIGNGISLEQWLQYGPVDSLLYFMYMKPQQTKKMGLPLLPRIIDGYLELVAKDDGTNLDTPAQFVARLSRGPHAGVIQDENIITYSLIYNLAIALNTDDQKVVKEYLLKYQPGINENIEYYDQLIDEVLNYYRDIYLPQKTEEAPDHAHDDALQDLLESLKAWRDSGAGVTAEMAQNSAFQAAKKHDLKMKDWFKTLYQVFLGQSSGPKIGSFIVLVGLDRSIKTLEGHLNNR